MQYTYNSTYFNKIDSSDKAYFLGIITMNGTWYSVGNTIQVVLPSEDQQDLRKLAALLVGRLRYRSGVCPKIHCDAKTGCRLRFGNPGLTQGLLSHGVVGNKTNRYASGFVPPKYIPDYIRGLVKGGGCLTTHISKKDGRRVTTLFIIGSDKLLTFIQGVFSEVLGIPAGKISKRNNSFRIQYRARAHIARIYSYIKVME